MAIFNLDSGKQIDSTECFRFQNFWENQDNQHIASYDRIIGEIKESDYYNCDKLGYSDYSGTIEYKANQLWFIEKFGDLDGVIQIYGSHSYSDILIRIDVLNSNKELQEVLFGLENYPIIDEDFCSEIEEEAKEESFPSILSDFKRILQKLWNYDFYKLNDEFIRELFHECEQKSNEYWYFEYTNAYFNIHRMMERISQEDFLDIFSSAKESFGKSILISKE